MVKKTLSVLLYVLEVDANIADAMGFGSANKGVVLGGYSSVSAYMSSTGSGFSSGSGYSVGSGKNYSTGFANAIAISAASQLSAVYNVSAVRFFIRIKSFSVCSYENNCFWSKR